MLYRVEYEAFDSTGEHNDIHDTLYIKYTNFKTCVDAFLANKYGKDIFVSKITNVNYIKGDIF